MATLVVVEGPERGLGLRVGKTSVGVVIGRGAGVRLSLDGDATVSRRNCRVWYDEGAGGYLVEDLKSENGTMVDKEPLANGEKRPLADRDELAVGNCTILFLLEDLTVGSDDLLRDALERRRPPSGYSGRTQVR